MAKLLWKQELTLGELGINLLIGVSIVTAGWYLGRFVQMADVEILNGSVVQKHSARVSCEHSYTCNCIRTTDRNGSTSESCSTCYTHDYDVDWKLDTTLGDIKISRVSLQGTVEPERFTLAHIGDPVAESHLHTNYIKASPDSLFNTLSEKEVLKRFKDKIPKYPSTVYDYHYVDRVLAVGVNVPDMAGWNQDLAMRLKSLGSSKQVNIVLVFSSEADPQYADALKVAWLGGKKNDVIIVLGTPAYPSIAWSRVISWTDREVFKVQLRDALTDLKTVERKTVLDTIESHVASGFVRKHMADFAYLKELIEPPTWVLVLLALVSSMASVWASVKLRQNSSRIGGYGGNRSQSRFSNFKKSSLFNFKGKLKNVRI